MISLQEVGIQGERMCVGVGQCVGTGRCGYGGVGQCVGMCRCGCGGNGELIYTPTLPLVPCNSLP